MYIPKDLANKAEQLLLSVDFPIPEAKILRAISDLESWKGKRLQVFKTANSKHVEALMLILEENSLNSAGVVEVYLEECETAINNYKDCLRILSGKQSVEREELYEAFAEEYYASRNTINYFSKL